MSESKYIIAPSILSANFATLGEEVVNVLNVMVTVYVLLQDA